MRTELNFKTFGNGKSINEILYQINCWENEFDFIKVELNFITKLLKSHTFNSNTPNLYERIQLFLKDISTSKNNRHTLLIEIEDYKNELIGQNEKHHFENQNYYLTTFQKLAESVFNYFKNYKVLKESIYEYTQGILEPRKELENNL